MPTITVSGVDTKNAPSPLQLKSWQDAWGGHLTGLTPWQSTDGGMTFRCTTTTTPVSTVKNVVEADLNQWCPDGIGKCNWHVS